MDCIDLPQVMDRKNKMGEVCSMYGRELCRFQWGNLRERGHLEDPGIDGRIILILIFKKWKGEALTGLVFLGIGTGRGLV
jgi:hypothetical protein